MHICDNICNARVWTSSLTKSELWTLWTSGKKNAETVVRQQNDARQTRPGSFCHSHGKMSHGWPTPDWVTKDNHGPWSLRKIPFCVLWFFVCECDRCKAFIPACLRQNFGEHRCLQALVHKVGSDGDDAWNWAIQFRVVDGGSKSQFS